jgi:glycosyltransferase involved in cell wall biosynthesis
MPEPVTELAADSARIGILVVAYNAATTLAEVLDRIPPSVRSRVHDVLVCDDHSDDRTYLIGLGYKTIAEDLPLTVVRHPRNLGYGGNQKAGYRWAIDHGLDIVVLLHGDGQYAPERLEDVIGPIERDEADAVLGSRMMEEGAARRGGMPLYKYVGNRILTKLENVSVGTDLTEWHSGYRAYRVSALAQIPFDRNSDGFDFDTEIIIQLLEARQRIVEVPIPTYYGDEICYVNGVKYASDVARDALRYRAHKMGFGSGELAFASDAYEWKESAETSHGVIESWLAERPPSRILDLGCSSGELGARLRKLGHHVIGVDAAELPGVREAVDEFVEADLAAGLPSSLSGPFDIVIAADVLEHLPRPERLLAQARECLAPGGSVVVSIPNFVHWYPRLRMLFGWFDYDRRGILDAGHLRFFTRRSFEQLTVREGFAFRRQQAVGLPLEVLQRGGGPSGAKGRLANRLAGLDRLLVRLRPNLFAYQYVVELQPAAAAELDEGVAAEPDEGAAAEPDEPAAAAEPEERPA